MWYVLAADGQTPVAVTRIEEWGWWREANPIAVGKTKIGESEVSTVFLGMDHRHFGDGPPLLWETMIFGGDLDEYQWRYASYTEAVLGHERVVDAIRDGRDPDEESQDQSQNSVLYDAPPDNAKS